MESFISLNPLKRDFFNTVCPSCIHHEEDSKFDYQDIHLCISFTEKNHEVLSCPEYRRII